MKDKGAIKLGIEALKEIQKSRGMSIDEALTLLARTYDKGFIAPYEKQKEAVKLGIEALKRCRVIQQESVLKPFALLPGETED